MTFARSDHANDWQDQTGNLRSSIGYMISRMGRLFSERRLNKWPQKSAKDGVPLDGAKRGEALCRSIGEQTTGMTLVMVAGMNYAIYVESKGRDVITGAHTHAVRTLPQMIEQLKSDIKNVPM